MESKVPVKLPFYARLSFSLISLVLLLGIAYCAAEIIVPLILSFLIAVLLRPIVRFFHTKLKLPHVIAAIVTVLLWVLAVIGLLFLISWQVADITNDMTQIKQNLQNHWDSFQSWVQSQFNIDRTEQKQLIDNATKTDGNSSITSGIGGTVASFGATLANLIILPVYTFLLLLYRTHFIKFLFKLIPLKKHPILIDVLCQVKVALQSYIVGLMLQMLSVIVMTCLGYFIIGLEYALLLGLLTGILNLIPYIGILMACVISILVSLTTGNEMSIILYVILVNIVVQFIDNNILVPMVVSSKVEINALVSITGIIVGGTIAGIAGMFLAIPVMAILKLIFDRIPELEPWGYLLGDDLPKSFTWRKGIRLPRYQSDVLNMEGNYKQPEDSPILQPEELTDDTEADPEDAPR